MGGFPGAVAAALTAFAARAASAARIATAARSDEQRNRVLEHLRRARSVHVVRRTWRLLPLRRVQRAMGVRRGLAQLPGAWLLYAVGTLAALPARAATTSPAARIDEDVAAQQSRLLPGHRSMRVLHEQGRQDGLRSRRAELPLPWRQC